MKGSEEFECLVGVSARLRVVGDRGAVGEILVKSEGRIGGGEDGEAGDQRLDFSRWSGEGSCGEVHAGEEFAGGAGVFGGAEGSPGDGVFVEVDAGGDAVDFVGPVA